MSDALGDDRPRNLTLHLVRGREKAFAEDGDYYEAVIRVRMQTIARDRYVEDDLRCVAERAVHAAAAAYNLASTRITSVRLESIDADSERPTS